jgi:hypothetical protein
MANCEWQGEGGVKYCVDGDGTGQEKGKLA